jgi:hypothetical protein
MLNFFKRRRPSTVEVELDNPLAIRDLLDHPALRALLVETGATPETPPPLTWIGLAASGAIRFELTSPDMAA